MLKKMTHIQKGFKIGYAQTFCMSYLQWLRVSQKLKIPIIPHTDHYCI